MKQFQRCTRCIMDNSSDSSITFNHEGQCNYCIEAYERKDRVYFPNEEGQQKVQKLIGLVRKASEGKKYDCIMGLSGGLDSSYLAYLGSKWGLKVLAVHIDDGFDTEISKNNLAKLINATGFDYEVIEPDAEQFYGLTRAFMRAGVPNLAIPQDNILFAFLYRKMIEMDIEYFLTGTNFSLECILQRGNTHSNLDVVNIKDINRKFGDCGIDKLAFISNTQKMIYKYRYKIKTVQPLDYVDYNRDRAFSELKDFCGFEYYGRKHLENILTAFVQLIWFPEKFNVDKRTSHLSSMIVSGQMTREQALKELEEPLYNKQMMDEYIDIIKSKLKLSDAEYAEIMSAPIHQHSDYKTEDKMLYYKIAKKLLRR